MKVQDIGPFGASIMLVGEAPGETEVKTGQPFSGQSGKLLKSMLLHSGVDFAKCYVTNVVQERPPNNNFSYFYESSAKKVPTQMLKVAWFELQEKIHRMRPNIVIALGGEALRALTNKVSINKWRGIVMPCCGTKMIATFHPASVLRQMWGANPKEKVYSQMPIFELDAAKAKRHSTIEGYKSPAVNIQIAKSVQDVLDYCKTVRENKLRVALDTELVDFKLRCLSFACGPIECPHALVIPFIKFQDYGTFEINKGTIKVARGMPTPHSTSYWSAENELMVFDCISEVLRDSAVEKVGQNSMSFDAPLILQQLRMQIENHYMDTMHAHHDLYSELPMGLDFLCTMYTDYPNYWSDKDTALDKSEWEYCAMDSITTLVCSFCLEENLKAAGMHDYYFKHRRPLALALAEAQMEGLDIDEDRRKVLIAEQEEVLKNLKAQIKERTGEDLNPNSPVQMKRLLYETLGLPKVYKDGKVSTDEKALRALERKFRGLPILETIIMYRKTQKLLSTYLRAKTDKDGKMRTVWNPSGTEGARISSSKPLWKTGLQMQNIPKGVGRGITNIRDIFIAGRTKCICSMTN